jgi:hypothetical protein
VPCCRRLRGCSDVPVRPGSSHNPRFEGSSPSRRTHVTWGLYPLGVPLVKAVEGPRFPPRPLVSPDARTAPRLSQRHDHLPRAADRTRQPISSSASPGAKPAGMETFGSDRCYMPSASRRPTRTNSISERASSGTAGSGVVRLGRRTLRPGPAALPRCHGGGDRRREPRSRHPGCGLRDRHSSPAVPGGRLPGARDRSRRADGRPGAAVRSRSRGSKVRGLGPRRPEFNAVIAGQAWHWARSTAAWSPAGRSAAERCPARTRTRH